MQYIQILKVLLTILAAIAGGMLFRKIRIPTPMLTGSIVGVSVCTLILPHATFFPSELKTAVQIASGAVIGSRVSHKELRELKTLLLPALLLVLCLMAFNVVCAIGMYHTGIHDIPTAVFSSAPGSMADMTIMAPDFGADPVYVAVIQFCRLFFVNAAFPTLITFIAQKKLYPGPVREIVSAVQNDNGMQNCAPLPLTAVLAVAGGCLFKYLKIPSGAILGSAVFVAFQNIKYDRIYMPSPMKYIVQLGIGCYVGVQMNRESLYIIQTITVPVAILITSGIIYTYLCSLLIYRISKFDFATCMLMCSPGGLNEMSIIADEMGIDAPKIAVMHSIRLICIVAFFYKLIGVVELIVFF